ncbi:hypothetical protein BOO86_21650 [Mycobacterium sp. CBMA 234]|nr:hypothetical protein [Mycolicibacterium sp. CBMA 234]
MILTSAYPARLDVNQLVLLDHVVLYSADVGGPPSLHPAVPIRSGEIAVKRESVESGIAFFMKLKLIELSIDELGVRFYAGESALHFISILGSSYSAGLRQRVGWVIGNFSSLETESLRSQTKAVFDSWSEEFHWLEPDTIGGSEL